MKHVLALSSFFIALSPAEVQIQRDQILQRLSEVRVLEDQAITEKRDAEERAHLYGVRIDSIRRELRVFDRKNNLQFGNEISPRMERLREQRQNMLMKPKKDYWVWKGVEEWKNERLKYYQDQLTFIDNPDHVRNLVAQLIHENGALTADRTDGADKGCSLGIVQYHTCSHHKMMAKRFLELHPEWADWKFQMDWMAEQVEKRYKMYNGSIFRTVVHHNCPRCANLNADSEAGYWESNLYYTSLLVKDND